VYDKGIVMKIIDQHVLFFVLFFFGSVLLNKTVEAKVRGGATVVGTVRMNGGAVNPNLERIQVSFKLPIYTTEMSDRIKSLTISLITPNRSWNNCSPT